MTSTSSSAWSVSRAATVTSIRSRSWPEAVTSSAVTAPPACSTAVVSWLTEAPPAGTSSRTVIEYETEGTALTLCMFSRTPAEHRIRTGARWADRDRGALEPRRR